MKYLSSIPAPESYIYLASPYSGNTFSQHVRYEYTKYAVYKMIDSRLAVYSPIVSNHDLAISYDLPKDAIFWELVNSLFIQQCSEVWVLMLDGWEQSEGIRLERNYAEAINKPVRFCYFDAEYNLLVLDEEAHV